MIDRDTIKYNVKGYIMEEFLVGENPDSLGDSTPLISGGVLDSIATIKLVTFLEEQYDVEFEAHEMSIDHLDNLPAIADTVASKMEARR